MIYIRLFHGRTNPNQNMDDWGTDGPVFGPYEFVHTTYTYHIKLGRNGGHVDELFLYEDMMYYDGVYYGDWSFFSGDVLAKRNYSITSFEPEKASLPK